ncbi:MAG: sugar ABC transporter ATP-binding protein [Phycisphaerales bacterium]|nr:MAG: sugar ABC transporter ATP-binding protein [Phycisphaerales bacterium]
MMQNDHNPAAAARTVLLMSGIVKDFSGTRALDEVDFDVRRGEVHALIGENGAGKSTLMNVLAGRFSDYRGQIIFDGRPVRITSPRQALKMGIAVIYQELRVLGNLSVAENIMLGDERSHPWTKRLDRTFIRDQALRTIEYLGFDLDPDQSVGQLSTARQCMVEIAGAVRRKVKLLVFDEPTASLGGEDVERLFQVIKDLRAKGLGIVYISHRLGELPRVGDRVTVLRDGRKVGTRRISDCPVSEMSRMMLGHVLSEVFPEKTNRPGKCILKVRGLSRKGRFEDISFDLHEGEVLGIAGLLGSGRSEIARAIFGADRSVGLVEFQGRAMARRTPGRSCRNGIGMVPENRKLQGNIPARSVGENLNISILDRLAGRLGYQSPGRLADHARSMVERMKVQPPRLQTLVRNLSGGNQQKVIVGRWLAANPKVLIFDEPTQGIDIGTKAQIYKLIVKLAEEGRGIILISSELIEVGKLADRILVIRNGRLAKEIKGPLMDRDIEMLFEACVREVEHG